MNTQVINPLLSKDETKMTDFLSEKRRCSKTHSNKEELQPELRKLLDDPVTIDLSTQQFQSLLEEIDLQPDEKVKEHRRHLMSYELWK